MSAGSRRLASACVLAVVATVACGADDDTADEPTTTVESSAVADPGSGFQIPGYPAFSTPPTMLEVVEERDDTVVVRHQFGQVEIPSDPSRVYAEATTLAPSLLLDLPLVGADDWGEFRELPNADELFDGVDIAPAGETNYERIAALDPDLILTWSSVVFADDPEDAYDRYSQIAPTIVFNDNMYSFWRQASVDLGGALGSDVEDAFAGFDRAVRDACAPAQERIGDETVARLTISGDVIKIHGVGGYYGATPDDLIPAGDTQWFYEYCELVPSSELEDRFDLLNDDDANIEISAEVLPELEADHLIVVVQGDDDEPAILDSPIWASIPAVEAGNVYVLPSVAGYSDDLAIDALDTLGDAVASGGS
ncbi:MAG: ABC transporter substrate-binding protein [Actinomycetota bacterium]